MSAPTKPIRDVALAGEFARKCFGKFGFARCLNIRMPRSPNRSYKVYEIGTCPQVGEFVPKGDSAWDFAEAFEKAGFPMDARDPLFHRADIKYVNQIVESNSAEQVEMAI